MFILSFIQRFVLLNTDLITLYSCRAICIKDSISSTCQRNSLEKHLVFLLSNGQNELTCCTASLMHNVNSDFPETTNSTFHVFDLWHKRLGHPASNLNEKQT